MTILVWAASAVLPSMLAVAPVLEDVVAPANLRFHGHKAQLLC